MTMAERIQKLGRAIKRYRGSTRGSGENVVWVRGPQVARRGDIVRHLLALGRSKEQINADGRAIDGFKSVPEMAAWLDDLAVGHQIGN